MYLKTHRFYLVNGQKIKRRLWPTPKSKTVCFYAAHGRKTRIKKQTTNSDVDRLIIMEKHCK